MGGMGKLTDYNQAFAGTHTAWLTIIRLRFLLVVGQFKERIKICENLM